jgi:hypothetical protein
MMDTAEIDDWLARYKQAWRSDDPGQIAALFTDKARYSTAPWREPMVGAQAIGDWWRAMGESRLPWSFDCRVIARNDDLYVVRAVTRYPEGTDGEPGPTTFHNLWLVALSGTRAREFVEYFMEVE